MACTPEATLRMFKQLKIEPAVADLTTIGIDDTTLAAKSDPSSRTIRDIDFFRMLGIDETMAIDVSDFEGAEIILDLNQPIAPEFDQTCDLLVDGSLLDNIFDPVTGLKNIARLLRDGGRCLLLNAGNIHTRGLPYTLLSPFWFFDYFAWNNFDYCQVYVTLYDATSGASEVYAISYEHVARHVGPGYIKWIPVPQRMSVAVYAEKGPNSTWDQIPTQSPYRNEADWKKFSEIVDRYRAQNRAYLARSSSSFKNPNIPQGYIRIMPNGQPEAKMSQPRKPELAGIKA